MYLLQIELGKELLSPLQQSGGVLGSIIAILFFIIFYLFKILMKSTAEYKTFVKENINDFKAITKENRDTFNETMKRSDEVIAKNTEMFFSVKTIMEQIGKR